MLCRNAQERSWPRYLRICAAKLAADELNKLNGVHKLPDDLRLHASFCLRIENEGEAKLKVTDEMDLMPVEPMNIHVRDTVM